MPTGYTAMIEDRDDCTFEEFVWACARAFGAAVMMRESRFDCPITDDDVQDKSTHHADELAKAKAKLTALLGMPTKQLAAMAAEEYATETRTHQELLAKQAETSARYDRIRRQVEAWEPPSPEHIGLRDFMLQQIRISTEYSYDSAAPTLKTAGEWLAGQRKHLDWSIAYHAKGQAEQEARNISRVAWVRALRDSVPQP